MNFLKKSQINSVEASRGTHENQIHAKFLLKNDNEFREIRMFFNDNKKISSISTPNSNTTLTLSSRAIGEIASDELSEKFYNYAKAHLPTGT